MKKYLFGILSIAITAVVFAFALPGNSKEEAKLQDFYYQFEGAPGEENIMSKWTQLPDLQAYQNVDCPQGSDLACRIINTTNSGGHPTSVPLSGGLPVADGTINKQVVHREE